VISGGYPGHPQSTVVTVRTASTEAHDDRKEKTCFRSPCLPFNRRFTFSDARAVDGSTKHFSLAMLPSCPKSSRMEVSRRKRLGPEPRSASCVKTHSPFAASSNREALRRGNEWETVCGLCPVTDPDGYCMQFESPTDAPDESELEE